MAAYDCRVIKGLPNFTLTTGHLDNHGSKKWCEVKRALWYGENANVTETIVQAEEVTPRILAEI